MKRCGLGMLFTFVIVAVWAQPGFSQPGTWRSTITGVNLPLSASRIVDTKILIAASKTLEAIASENALSGRCRGTEIVESSQPRPSRIVDALENGLTKQGFKLENLPGGDGSRYSVAARRGGRLIILNVNGIENGRMVIAWCALEPVNRAG